MPEIKFPIAGEIYLTCIRYSSDSKIFVQAIWSQENRFTYVHLTKLFNTMQLDQTG